jgi:hypothetical protein
MRRRSTRILHANPPNLGKHALFHEEKKAALMPTKRHARGK